MFSAYVINLDHATERWEGLQDEASAAGLRLTRVMAVYGDELPDPLPDFDARSYRLRHGKHPNPREVGCYLSHVRALEMFLKSGEKWGLVLEDDVRLPVGLSNLLERAVEEGGENTFDMLRLSGLHSGTPSTLIDLDSSHRIAVNLSRQTGAGAYMVNRKAAEGLVANLLPMRVPLDHAFDREWLMGFKACSLVPYPVEQNERYATSIVHSAKYGPSRYLTVFPYRAINETQRVVHRGLQCLRHRAA
ncbi:MAG: glycosyltransferase family 25 protein [Planctomycetota bacterium]